MIFFCVCLFIKTLQVKPPISLSLPQSLCWECEEKSKLIEQFITRIDQLSYLFYDRIMFVESHLPGGLNL